MRLDDWARSHRIDRQVEVIRCPRVGLTSLDGLAAFPLLQQLDVSENFLDQLPRLDQLRDLTYLNVSGNRLRQIPSLPGSLIHLECTRNRLTHLPDLSYLTKLNQLLCSFNALEKLPDLSATRLVLLDARCNALRRKPVLPAWIRFVLLDGNPMDEPEDGTGDASESTGR